MLQRTKKTDKTLRMAAQGLELDPDLEPELELDPEPDLDPEPAESTRKRNAESEETSPKRSKKN